METTPSSTEVRLINAPDLIEPRGHYSHVSVAGGMAYISGQLPVDADGEPLTDRPLDEQIRQTLSNLDRCLAAVASDKSRLVQVRVYVTDIAHWPGFDHIYANWIGEHRPARAVAGVKELHYGAAIEIEAVAAVTGG
jgi:reactive intermediate/imine deaminase